MNDRHAFANELLLEKLSQLSSAPYQPHSATSKAAAVAVTPLVKPQRVVIFKAISASKSYGLTDCEIQRMFGLSGDSVRPRRGQLVKDGLVVDSGRVRKTTKGLDAVVWVALEHQT